MSLRERLSATDAEGPAGAVGEIRGSTVGGRSYQELKRRVHQTLLDRVDLARLQKLEPEQITEEMRNLIAQILAEDDVALNDLERRLLTRDIRNEMLGLGPL